MNIEQSNKGFTLLEAVLASVIFVVAAAGFYATLAAVRGPVARNNRALEATLLAKELQEGLYVKVNSNEWRTNEWSTAAGDKLAPRVISRNGVDYTVTYTVTPADVNAPGPRSVSVNINYPDPQ